MKRPIRFALTLGILGIALWLPAQKAGAIIECSYVNGQTCDPWNGDTSMKCWAASAGREVNCYCGTGSEVWGCLIPVR
jgi:hypothetical protein